ncbi:hypothetical protein G5714_002447 [Onychostoma macrolepis]|uniref:Uncharacterized protein n=1 Tax=Onychostoma macrolepis TaxID=369639 RepID=A0A7J6DGH2_9TELE|nr:hypothetical protein G5714_002447 [Onychostoma macrolepis]
MDILQPKAANDLQWQRKEQQDCDTSGHLTPSLNHQELTSIISSLASDLRQSPGPQTGALFFVRLHRKFPQRFLFQQPEVVMEQTLERGSHSEFLFGQPEASNGTDTGKGFAQRFLFRQPEADNGADTGKKYTQRFLFGSQR